MTLNKKSDCSAVISVVFKMPSSINIFSKLIRNKIPNRLQILKCGGIHHDRQDFFIINNLHWQMIEFSCKTDFSFHAENCFLL